MTHLGCYCTTMYEWELIKKELGSSNGRIVYLESRLSSLLDQIQDLKNEISNLKQINEELSHCIIYL